VPSGPRYQPPAARLPPSLTSSTGFSLRQISCAFPQRVWTRQPDGGFAGDGTPPHPPDIAAARRMPSLRIAPPPPRLPHPMFFRTAAARPTSSGIDACTSSPTSATTLADMKAALDIAVRKRGVYCLVFHPYNWIRNDQVVALVDHAVKAHGKKVKFLPFREVHARLTKNFLAGQPAPYFKRSVFHLPGNMQVGHSRSD